MLIYKQSKGWCVKGCCEPMLTSFKYWQEGDLQQSIKA